MDSVTIKKMIAGKPGEACGIAWLGDKVIGMIFKRFNGDIWQAENADGRPMVDDEGNSVFKSMTEAMFVVEHGEAVPF